MDLVGYDQSVFDAIVDGYRELAAQLGIPQVQAIPLSALGGDNMIAASTAMPWYAGPTLLDHLEQVNGADARSIRHPQCRVPFAGAMGESAEPGFGWFRRHLVRGRVAVGDEVAVLPLGRRSTVARIVTADGDLAQAGDGRR